mmetsp:Transcript_57680/g.185344  ORF Transcript_57680/g.185344 Transcript_57680/m.185344 type:complete len:223 (+) Transcript_57680:786-1454(+)
MQSSRCLWLRPRSTARCVPKASSGSEVHARASCHQAQPIYAESLVAPLRGQVGRILSSPCHWLSLLQLVVLRSSPRSCSGSHSTSRSGPRSRRKRHGQRLLATTRRSCAASTQCSDVPPTRWRWGRPVRSLLMLWSMVCSCRQVRCFLPCTRRLWTARLGVPLQPTRTSHLTPLESVRVPALAASLPRHCCLRLWGLSCTATASRWRTLLAQTPSAESCKGS